jgi:endonuclease YncB( thermonuclease family)
VVDGDTIVVTDSAGAKHRVRLYGVDAPESKQSCTLANGSSWACGQRSAEALRVYVGDKPVHCVITDTDRYGREVGLCDAGRNKPLNSWLVSNGWALVYRQYGGAQFDGDEARAKTARAGVWQGAFMEPWRWRQAQRHAEG